MTTESLRQDPYYQGRLNHLPSVSRDTARKRLKRILKRIDESQQPTLILHQLQPVAVLIPYGQFLRIRHLIDPVAFAQ